MMLSDILNRYFVLPLNQSELVSFSTEDHPEHGEIIVITWTDSYTLDSFCQEFVDQEVDTDLGNTFHYKGQFNVTPIGDGGPVAFIALDVVPLSQQPAADAETKTVPVPTHVHLIGETAVIVGTPGRGWDEDAQDAHNCDDMGCPTIGPHVLARVPFTDEREEQKT